MGKRIRRMDGRTWQAKHLADVRGKLTAHCGGNPSPVQAALVSRAAQLSLYVAELDLKTEQSATRTMTGHDAAQYLAWSNSLSRTLALLGTAPPRARAPTLADHLAAHGAAA